MAQLREVGGETGRRQMGYVVREASRGGTQGEIDSQPNAPRPWEGDSKRSERDGTWTPVASTAAPSAVWQETTSWPCRSSATYSGGSSGTLRRVQPRRWGAICLR